MNIKDLVNAKKEEVEKKPIEFVDFVSSYINKGLKPASIRPEKWSEIVLLSKGNGRDVLDIMYAFDDGSENDGFVYRGYYNDGVKE